MKPARPAAVVPSGATPVAAAVALGTTPLAVDARGVPKLLQASAYSPALPAKTATDSARLHVARLVQAWGVRSTAMPAIEVLGEIPVRGGTIVRLRQRIDGIPVEAGELRVLVRPDGGLSAIGGALVGTDAVRAPLGFAHDDAEAIAVAMRHVYGSFSVGGLTTQQRRTDTRVLGGRSGNVDVQMAVARKMWHREAGGVLVPAYVVEAYSSAANSTAGDATRTVVRDGRVLAHRSIVADATFNYRVFAETTGELHPFDGPIADSTPHPTGAPGAPYPPFVLPALVTVNSLNGPGDPWLPAGRTETFGNNVEAYADVNAPSGLTFGDFRATTTAAGTFDRTYDTAQGPLASQGQQMAAITSLFYNINWLHDFWYDAGFTEAAGNGQDNNFGRGGEDRDAILAEAQDNALGGSRNNANMSTPSDGLPPRMQVFVWSGKDTRSLAIGTRTPATGTASFSPANYDVTAAVALADDGTATTTDACQPIVNDVHDKIVVVDRGVCSFKFKALQVQNAGGIGMILANNNTATVPPGLGDDPTVTTPITIAIMSVIQSDGVTIKADLAAGPITATLKRAVQPDLDGGHDSTLVAHEFGHYLHHRLQLCGTRTCSALSEGWGDFLALMTITRAGDDLTAAYPFSVYAVGGIVADPGYFGIRRAPYSVNPAINSLSFRHMADGEALPTTHPFLLFGNNAEVHNAGEIWTAMLWEGYVALQQAGTDFDEVRAKMASYIVAGLLLAPDDGTPTETRDAILAAAKAASATDHDILVAAFARRGIGSCAVSPDRDSTTFVGIAESTEVRARALPGAAATVEMGSCDNDGVIDGTEVGRITVPVANMGHAPMTNATVSLASTTPGVTVTTLPITIAALAQYETTDVVFEFALDDTATTPLAGDFTMTITSAGACGDPVALPIAVRLNTDDVPATSATDTFDTATSVWTPALTPVWAQQRESALDGIWHGSDLGIVSDGALESPLLQADATLPVVVTFAHRYSFEFSANTAFDGGVIEISTDGGTTYADVKTLIPTIGYSVTPLAAGNPLEGRNAFTGNNATFPDAETVTLDFGTQLAGMSFKLRFRIATDGGVGAPGWDIDDLAFTGIVGTPFPTQVADTGECANPMPPDAMVEPPMPDADDVDPPPPPPPGDDGDGGCCDAGPMRTSNLGFGLLVLGLLFRRRRK